MFTMISSRLPSRWPRIAIQIRHLSSPNSPDSPPSSAATTSSSDLSASSKFYLKSPGTEDWHVKKPMPGSSGRVYKWPTYNEIIHPPGNDHETGKPRPAYICHMRCLIRYSPWKLWYIANMCRGMSVDQALKEYSFLNKRGAAICKEVIEEAQEIAVKEHNVEFKSNLWVAESFCTKADVVKGYRRHARGRLGLVEYHYTNYYVKLEEGKPPKDYIEWKRNKNPHELLEDYVTEHRKKTIPFHHP